MKKILFCIGLMVLTVLPSSSVFAFDVSEDHYTFETKINMISQQSNLEVIEFVLKNTYGVPESEYIKYKAVQVANSLTKAERLSITSIVKDVNATGAITIPGSISAMIAEKAKDLVSGPQTFQNIPMWGRYWVYTGLGNRLDYSLGKSVVIGTHNISIAPNINGAMPGTQMAFSVDGVEITTDNKLTNGQFEYIGRYMNVKTINSYPWYIGWNKPENAFMYVAIRNGIYVIQIGYVVDDGNTYTGNSDVWVEGFSLIASKPMVMTTVTEGLLAYHDYAPEGNMFSEIKTDKFDFQPLIDASSQLVGKFPFCLPFDVKRVVSSFSAPPVAPVFTVDFPSSVFGSHASIDVDFKKFDKLAVIIRWGVYLGFLFGLIVSTKSLIK